MTYSALPVTRHVHSLPDVPDEYSGTSRGEQVPPVRGGDQVLDGRGVGLHLPLIDGANRLTLPHANPTPEEHKS